MSNSTSCQPTSHHSVVDYILITAWILIFNFQTAPTDNNALKTKLEYYLFFCLGQNCVFIDHVCAHVHKCGMTGLSVTECNLFEIYNLYEKRNDISHSWLFWLLRHKEAWPIALT